MTAFERSEQISNEVSITGSEESTQRITIDVSNGLLHHGVDVLPAETDKGRQSIHDKTMKTRIRLFSCWTGGFSASLHGGRNRISEEARIGKIPL